jgi:hypothetical protein
VYPRRSPRWVLSDHPKDQLADLLGRLSSSNLRPNSGDQPPNENLPGASGRRFRA